MNLAKKCLWFLKILKLYSQSEQNIADIKEGIKPMTLRIILWITFNIILYFTFGKGFARILSSKKGIGKTAISIWGKLREKTTAKVLYRLIVAVASSASITLAAIFAQYIYDIYNKSPDNSLSIAYIFLFVGTAISFYFSYSKDVLTYNDKTYMFVTTGTSKGYSEK